MKKLQKLTIILGLIFVLCIFFNTAISSASSDVVVSMQIDNPTMKVNGQNTRIDSGSATTPIISNGRTLVPIRAIIEAFGGKVAWNENTRTVTLSLEDDTIKLTIDSKTAYLNNKSYTLDVAPAIVNGRTMLPIRFIAEGFNLGVAWDGNSRTVTIISNTFTDAEYQQVKSMVPAYSGKPYVTINGNKPFFKDYEIIESSFEFYADLDNLGRCDVALASVGTDIMPTEERGSISSVTPTGWINASYDVVSGGYLYNRCHLIGFQLTGENANKRNLITGTRYLNIEGMLPFENKIDDYVERTNNNVVFRSTPVFTGNNLLADGVLLEAYSVEDGGRGISFCVYCYNVQPQITIDYSTGRSSLSGGVTSTTTQTASKPVTSGSSATSTQTVSKPATSGNTTTTTAPTGIYRTPTGKRYHYDPDCGGKNSYSVTLDAALAAGLTPCQKCAK